MLVRGGRCMHVAKILILILILILSISGGRKDKELRRQRNGDVV